MVQYVIAALIGLVVGGVVCFPLGIRYRKNVSEKEISSAEEEGRVPGPEARRFGQGERGDQDHQAQPD